MGLDGSVRPDMREPGCDALLIDLYELTMVHAFHAEGMAEVPATFSLTVRRLPPERGFLVAAGLEDALAYLGGLQFSDGDLDRLERLGRFAPEFLSWLGRLRFTGRVRAVPEGRIVFAGEPLLEVDAPLGVAQLAETALLNQITYQTAVATKAARCRYAAGDRAVVDFTLRRTHGGEAGMRATRACAIAGFAGTSNVAGALRFGLPASGTMAHSFVTAFPTELEAFRAFARRRGPGDGDAGPVLLIDTYDVTGGVEAAIVVARELAAEGRTLAGIRIDSGDVGALARQVRARLDEAGLSGVRIVASGGLDEHSVSALLSAGAPIDAFGVGTRVGTSEDAPTLESVYKMVAVDGRPVAKRSPGKEYLPGAKQVWRTGAGDVLALRDEDPPRPGADPLLVEVPVAAGGDPAAAVAAARLRLEADWDRLPEGCKRLREPAPYPVELSAGLRRTAGETASHA